MRGPNGVVVDVIRYRDKMQYDRRCCRAHPARRVHRRVQDPDELGEGGRLRRAGRGRPRTAGDRPEEDRGLAKYVLGEECQADGDTGDVGNSPRQFRSVLLPGAAPADDPRLRQAPPAERLTGLRVGSAGAEIVAPGPPKSEHQVDVDQLAALGVPSAELVGDDDARHPG